MSAMRQGGRALWREAAIRTCGSYMAAQCRGITRRAYIRVASCRQCRIGAALERMLRVLSA